MNTYVLNYFGNAIAVIIATDEAELKTKLKTAIQEEVGAEKDSQFSLTLGSIGDYGESTNILVDYVSEGEFIQADTDFDLITVISY